MYIKHRVKFPLRETIKYMSCEKVKTLNRGDAVKCIRCGQPIVISKETVIPYGDGNHMIECHNKTFGDEICGYRASVYYYFDRKMPAYFGKKVKEKLENDEVYTEETSGNVFGFFEEP